MVSALRPPRPLREAHPGQLRRDRKASGNNASLFETEVAIPAWSRSADDNVIDQLKLQDSASFENSAGKPHIGFGRGGVTRRVIVDHDERISRVRDHRLKDFSRVGEGLVDGPLTNRGNLNEMLFGVEENNPEQLTIEKAHFGTEIGDCVWTVDGERLTLLP
jgi:hypothetical protein